MAMSIRKLKVEEDEEGDDEAISPFSMKQPGRALFVGSGASGKTYAAVPLILDYLKWDLIFVYSKYLDAPIYKAMKKETDKMEEKLKSRRVLWADSMENFIEPKDLNRKNKSIYLVDDMINEDRKSLNSISHLYTAGRHGNASVICLMQSFVSGLPVVGRKNVTNLGLFRGVSGDDLDEIFRSYDMSPLTKPEFIKLYRACTTRDYGFLWIELRSKNPPYTKFRFLFDHPFDPSKLNDKDYGDPVPPMFVSPPKDVDDVDDFIEALKNKNEKRVPSRMEKKSSDQRLRLLMGEVSAGNDSQIVKKEIKEILQSFVNSGTYTSAKAKQIWNSIQ